MAELKPCPFCGRTPTVDDCGDRRYFVRCKCGIVQDKLYAQKCDAIRRWNTRKIDKDTNVPSTDCISRQAAIDDMKNMYQAAEKWGREAADDVIKARAESCMATLVEMKLRIEKLPTAQPEKETPKRVLWTGWKGYRDTRYKCPNCKKPVKNDDVYCHRCGQKLMFPYVDWTPYVEGQKQELIVRWDDE